MKTSSCLRIFILEESLAFFFNPVADQNLAVTCPRLSTSTLFAVPAAARAADLATRPVSDQPRDSTGLLLVVEVESFTEINCSDTESVKSQKHQI